MYARHGQQSASFLMDYTEELQAALLNLHGVTSTYIDSVPANEEFQGETVWRRYVTVLDLPPVDSPQTAVKVARPPIKKRPSRKERICHAESRRQGCEPIVIGWATRKSSTS